MPFGKVTLTFPLLEIITFAAGTTFPFESVIFDVAPVKFTDFGSDAVIVVGLGIVVEDLLGDGVAIGVGVADGLGVGFGDALGVALTVGLGVGVALVDGLGVGAGADPPPPPPPPPPPLPP